MHMKLKTIVLSLAALAALAACKSQFETLLSSNDVDAKYKAAMDLFNDGKYLKAGQLFESMAILTDGTERDDTVRYYWALSNYRYKTTTRRNPTSPSSSRSTRRAPSPATPASCGSTACTGRPCAGSWTRPRPGTASRRSSPTSWSIRKRRSTWKPAPR